MSSGQVNLISSNEMFALTTEYPYNIKRTVIKLVLECPCKLLRPFPVSSILMLPFFTPSALLSLNAQRSPPPACPPPDMRQMALRSPVSVSSISMGSSWLAKVNTKSVSGPKPALCICVRLRVSPSEKVMVS